MHRCLQAATVCLALIAMLFGALVNTPTASAHTLQQKHVTTVTIPQVSAGTCTQRLRPVFDATTNFGFLHHYYLATNATVNGSFWIYDATHAGPFPWVQWGSSYPQPNVSRWGVSEGWLSSNWPNNWNMFWGDAWYVQWSC